MNAITRIFIILSLLAPMFASAQQPGSVGYNTTVLPAHGLGDTRRVVPDRWGAWAKGEDGSLGWTFSGRTEQEARQLAIDDCVARGSRNCVVSRTFVNACAAIAASPVDRRFQISAKGLRWVRREALKACGPDCRIVFEGCAVR